MSGDVGVLELDNLEFRIGRKTLLYDVSLAVRPGSLHVVLGPNGAGKTTLIRLCLGDLRASNGEIRLLGTPVSKIPLDRQAQIRSYAGPMDYIAFPFTARELCLLGLQSSPASEGREQAREVIDEVFDLLDVSSFADRIVMTLSSGERERVLVARSFVQVWRRPGRRVLLLDEPTANLDLAHQHTTMQALQAANARGIAVLTVVHDVNLASRYADAVTLLRDGRVLASGPVESTLTEKHLSQLFGVPIALVHSEKLARPLIAVVGHPGLRGNPAR